MTLEEKLSKFSEALAKETQKHGDKVVQEYEKTLENNFNAHKEEAFRHADLQLKQAFSNYQKEKTKYVSTANINIKKTIRKKTLELKETLYNEIVDNLNSFKQTNEYINLLKKYIEKVEQYSHNSEFTIFIDKSDEHLIDEIHKFTNHKIKFSYDSIIGGIYAYLPNEKTLLNLSFKDKLTDLIAEFNWDEENCNE